MKKFNAIGINIYGGGFTLGVMKHFNVKGQWEEITLGKDTWDINFGKMGIPRPLRIDDWPIEQFSGKVDFVYANPPCVPWSMANMRAGYTNDKRFFDPRLDLTKHTFDVALRLNPTVFISESVENAYNIGFKYYKEFIPSFIEKDYAITIFLTDAVLHGLPSVRRRFHFCAHKIALSFIKPDMVTFRPTTVRMAIADLEGNKEISQNEIHYENAKKYNEIMQQTKPGKTLAQTFEKIKDKYTGFHGSFLNKRLFWDSPANTIVGLDYFVHPECHRFTTWREGLRLMSFPDTFKAVRGNEAADSVTPLMGNYLSEMVKKALLKNKPSDKKLSIIDWRPLGKPYGVAAMIKKSKEETF